MPVLIVVTYVLILGLSVAISGYLSFEGLERTAHEITLPLVVFLMMIILVMDATISYFRSSGRRYALPIVIWSVAAFFSIASNFNFLYSNFMRDDVTQSTVREQLAVFRSDLVETRDAIMQLDRVEYVTGQRTDLRVELDNLREQVNDPLRPGCGEECRSHMAAIERILGREITNLAVPSLGSSPDVVNDWYDRYAVAARQIQDVALKQTGFGEIVALRNRIDEALRRYDTLERVMNTGAGLNALSQLSQLSLDIEREANALLPEGEVVTHRYIDPTLGRLGEIVYAFQNGFGEVPNPMATAVSLVLASIVDLLPFLLSFALFGRGRLEKTVEKSTPRSRSGRRAIN